jgi:nitroimidazol reductase NimA-like FMN-containing flavoprotein (pyridoxamine 5'-phosphate oxidase superfamily)
MTGRYTKEEILKFLREMAIMSAAVTGERGPIATMFLFAVDDDFTFYVATHRESFKAKGLVADGRVGMEVWKHRQMLVQMDGVAQEVTDRAELDGILDKLAEASEKVEDFWPPMLRIREEGGLIAFKIKLKWMRALDLGNTSIYAGDPPFSEYTFDL